MKSKRMHICSDSIKFSVLIVIEHCSIATLFVGCFKNARKRKTRVQTTVLFEHSFRQEYQAKNALVQVNKKKYVPLFVFYLSVRLMIKL